MVDAVKAPIAAFADAEPLRTLFDAGRGHLIGTSGAITSLAGLHLGLPRYDRSKVDGLWMTRAECEAVRAPAGGADHGASGRASPASAPTAPTWCWPARRSWRRCRRSGRASGCGSPTAGLREGVLMSLMGERRRHRRRRRR